MPFAATWTYPTHVRFGPGRVAELGQACAAAGIARPLVVTDAGVAALPIFGRALDALGEAGLEPAVFAEVRPNPAEADVAAGLAALRAGGHDGVVAVGGGSALDAGKLVAFMAGQTRPMWDFEDGGDRWTRADPAGVLPVVAVPTTAGAGSEVGRAAVVTNPATAAKTMIFHPSMLPVQVICDPALTVDLPPHLTAGTGMDALAHCLEAFCATGYHPMAEGIAVEGVRLVRENLLAAYRDGTDLAARANMLAASAMGAVAFQKGLGAVHALSHPLGALYDTHHGLTNAILMPYVLDFNRETIWDKADRLAGWLGLDGGFSGLMDFVLRLRRDLGVPHTLDKIGVDDRRFETMAAMAVADPTAAGNPRRLTEQDALEMYWRAYDGRLG
jgi:alcohol dehydrogenase class IV